MKVRYATDKNDQDTWSDWSEPLTINVVSRFDYGEKISPDSHVSSDWKNEGNAYDDKPFVSAAKYDKSGDNGWCDDPLVLKLDDPVAIGGFKIRARKLPKLDMMSIKSVSYTHLTLPTN